MSRELVARGGAAFASREAAALHCVRVDFLCDWPATSRAGVLRQQCTERRVARRHCSPTRVDEYCPLRFRFWETVHWFPGPRDWRQHTQRVGWASCLVRFDCEARVGCAPRSFCFKDAVRFRAPSLSAMTESLLQRWAHYNAAPLQLPVDAAQLSLRTRETLALRACGSRAPVSPQQDASGGPWPGSAHARFVLCDRRAAPQEKSCGCFGV